MHFAVESTVLIRFFFLVEEEDDDSSACSFMFYMCLTTACCVAAYPIPPTMIFNMLTIKSFFIVEYFHLWREDSVNCGHKISPFALNSHIVNCIHIRAIYERSSYSIDRKIDNNALTQNEFLFMYIFGLNQKMHLIYFQHFFVSGTTFCFGFCSEASVLIA